MMGVVCSPHVPSYGIEVDGVQWLLRTNLGLGSEFLIVEELEAVCGDGLPWSAWEVRMVMVDGVSLVDLRDGWVSLVE